MGFTAKRGRPSNKEIEKGLEKDRGTPELQRKIQSGTNREVIEYLAEKSIISADQEFAANRFRWLYILRYGLPHVTAINPELFAGREIKWHNEEWREKREQEFTEAISELKKIHAHKAVLNAALYNIFSTHDIKPLREGLSLLDKLWTKA